MAPKMIFRDETKELSGHCISLGRYRFHGFDIEFFYEGQQRYLPDVQNQNESGLLRIPLNVL
jgi:hypothetical protein